MSQELAELRYVGDGLQSAASRLAEWVREQVDVPYEVHMAALEGTDYVNQWTDARTGYATSGTNSDGKDLTSE